MPAGLQQGQSRDAIRKVSQACQRCRTLKVKCSGTRPCARCGRSGHPCTFSGESKRISISESYLRQLEERTRRVVSPHREERTSSSHRLSEQVSNAPHDDDYSHHATTASTTRGSPISVCRSSPPQPPHPPPPAGPVAPAAASAASAATAASASAAVGASDQRDVNAHNNLHGAQIHCQDHAGWNQRPAAPGNDSRPRSRSPETSIGSPFGQNPLADNDYTFAEMNGRFWYMGPSSSWSFCRRVFALLGKRLPASSYEHALDPGHFDGGAFNLRWRPLAAEDTPDVSNLPPFDVAHFLFNTAKFYLGTIFQIIDEQEFLHNMHELYEDAATKATSSRHWYAQYLLILAYGKASIASQRDSDGGPPGHQYASRAMALMPDMSGLAPNASHAVQALVLGALYLQSIDMRISALQHLGHALRMAIIEGWHRHMPEDVVGAKHSHRCNIIFWMVYMLDREFGPLMGNPSSIRDEDITAKSPSEMDNSLEALNLTLHIRLARLMAQIITQIYGVGKEFDGTLVVNTQKVLRQLARLSKDLTNLLNTYFQGSVNRASRMALRLILAYHHCVVLTTRPLVMCALHKHIRQTDALRSGRISLSPPVAYLLQSCIDSAQSVLKTLRVIGEEDLLEAFLPFQLEDAFSSAFILYIVRAVNPGLVQDESWRDDIDSVLDNMISKGSVVAPLRKKELSQLEYIVGVLTPRANEYPVPPMTVAETQPGDDEPPVSPVMTQTEDTGWDFIVADDAMGLSPDHLLDLAAQLGLDPNFNCL